MAYERLHWVESETPLSAENFNNIEDGIEELKSQKVDKVSGKALSDQNYTAAEKTKLAGIEDGAEVNVQPDWNQTNTSADDFIQNKPGNASSSSAGFMSASDKSKLDGVQAGAQVNRTYTAVTGKPAAAASPAFGGTVTVSQVSQSTTGQVSVTDRVITMPNSDASTSAHGLMSAADKTKLNGIAAGAQVNPGNATTSAAGLMSAADKTKLNGIAEGATKNNAVATTSANGLMSSSDKTKLNGIAAGAQVNPGNATTSAAGLMSASDKSKLDGIAAGAQVNRIYTAVTGKPTGSVAPGFGDTVTVSQVAQNVNGQVSVTDRVIKMPNSNASTSAHGLMSAADKTKLNGIAENANLFSLAVVNLRADVNITIPANGNATVNITSAELNGKTLICLASAVLYGASLEINELQYQVRGDVSSSGAKGYEIRVFNHSNSSVTLKVVRADIVYVA